MYPPGGGGFGKRRGPKPTHELGYLAALNDDEFDEFKKREAKFYLWELDVSDPMYEKWLKEGCHPKYHNWLKLPKSAAVKSNPRAAHPKHPLHAPEDVTLWVWETLTRLIEAWHKENGYQWPHLPNECD
jgi:hypothetical protein